MNSEQIWQQACKIIGITDAPPLGEPASAMKMLEWLLVPLPHGIRLTGTCEGWTVKSTAGTLISHEVALPDALAAAVVATQEQSR